MNQEATEIEVEVLEIDGLAPVAANYNPEQNPQAKNEWQDWRQWGGRVRKLDSRWWPLWVILGLIGLVLLFTVGLVVGVVFLILRIFTKILRAIFG